MARSRNAQSQDGRAARRRAGGLALAAAALAASALAPSRALACGDGEAPTECGGVSAETGARWMLLRVSAALKGDKARALDDFARGRAGFRTADTYVFCVGPDGVMSAHPSAALQGQDVRDLHDETGHRFIREMMERAEPGAVSVVRYLFPKPGGTTALPKTTYYTRAGDQVCGVGVYDDEAANEVAGAPAQTPAERAARFRRALDARMPADLRAEWGAFLEALDAETAARDAAAKRVRDGLRSAEAALAGDR